MSPELRSFIAEHVDSVVQVEVLILLHAQRDTTWTAEQLSEKLRIDSSWAAQQLNDLCTRGILTCDHSVSPVQYRYGPKDPRLDQLVGELAQAYADRRVTVINLIYAKPIDKIRSFADAFRIRRERPNG